MDYPIRTKINKYILKEKLLVHASCISNIEHLKPFSGGKLYTTENLSCAIHCATRRTLTGIRRKNRNSIRLKTFFLFGRPFTFCSIAKDHIDLFLGIDITLYFFKKGEFSIEVPIYKKLSKYTRNMIHGGNEWTRNKKLEPLHEINVKPGDILYVGVHNKNSSIWYIFIKFLIFTSRERMKQFFKETH